MPMTRQEVDNAHLQMRSELEGFAVLLNRQKLTDEEWAAACTKLAAAIAAKALTGNQSFPVALRNLDALAALNPFRA